MARSPRAKSKHKLEALIEINRRGDIIMKYSLWEAGLPDFSLIFATLLLIWVGAFNSLNRIYQLVMGILILYGKSSKKQESKTHCFLFA